MVLEEPFAEGNSPLHRCDPRIKVFTAVLYAATVAVLSTHEIVGAALAFSAMLALAAWLDVRKLAARLLLANAFVGFLWLVLPWSVAGAPLHRLGPLVLTHEGLRLALLITLKCNAILLGFVALVGTSRVFDVGHALIRLGVPKKLVLILLFCFRYLHVIHGEYHRLVAAMTVRGFRPQTNLRTYRAYANLLGALLVRSHDRALRIYQAMLCRGFSGDFPVLSEFRARLADYAIGGAVIAFAILLGVLQWRLTT